MTFYEPFELEHWFVNVFSGNKDVFLTVSLLVITGMCAMFKMPTSSYLVLLGIFAAIIGVTTANILLMITILILAPVLFWLIGRITG